MSSHEYENGVHPRVTQERWQTEVDIRFDNLRGLITTWEDRLEEARPTADEEALSELAETAISEVDEAWGLNGHSFLVSGHWRTADVKRVVEQSNDGRVEEYDGAISWTIEDEEAFEVCENNGFTWRNKSGTDDRARLGMQFKMNNRRLVVPYLAIEMYPWATALPEEISLTYVPKLEYDEAMAHEERVREHLALQDGLTRLYVSRPEFLVQSQKRQQRLADSIVHTTNEYISAPGVTTLVNLSTSEIYERVDHSTPYGFSKIDLSKYTDEKTVSLSAELLGVDIMERGVLLANRINRPDQFINRDAGLCMVVNTVFKDEENPRHVYIPISKSTIDEEHGISFQ